MAGDDRSIGDLIRDLTRDLSALFREEVALARAEIQQSVSQLVKDALLLVVGGVVAYTGLLALIAAAILGLAEEIEPWLAALIVGGVILLIGVVMLLRGARDIRNVEFAPKRTAQTLKEDAEIIKEKLP